MVRELLESGVANGQAGMIFPEGLRVSIAELVDVADLDMRVDEVRFGGFVVAHRDDFLRGRYGAPVVGERVVELGDCRRGQRVADPDCRRVEQSQRVARGGSPGVNGAKTLGLRLLALLSLDRALPCSCRRSFADRPRRRELPPTANPTRNSGGKPECRRGTAPTPSRGCALPRGRGCAFRRPEGRARAESSPKSSRSYRSPPVAAEHPRPAYAQTSRSRPGMPRRKPTGRCGGWSWRKCCRGSVA